MLPALFDAIDARDARAFATFLAPDCVFRFGNAPAVAGIGPITEQVAAFFASIAAIRHRIEEAWPVPGALVCHGRVTYTRLDGSTLEVPFSNVLKSGPAGIREYLVFADTSDLYR